MHPKQSQRWDVVKVRPVQRSCEPCGRTEGLVNLGQCQGMTWGQSSGMARATATGSVSRARGDAARVLAAIVPFQPDPAQSPPLVLPQLRLTLHFQVHGLGVLADGVAGGADVFSRVCVLDALQGQGRHAGVAVHHQVPVQSLPGGKRARESPRRRGGRRPGHLLSGTSLTFSPQAVPMSLTYGPS